MANFKYNLKCPATSSRSVDNGYPADRKFDIDSSGPLIRNDAKQSIRNVMEVLKKQLKDIDTELAKMLQKETENHRRHA